MNKSEQNGDHTGHFTLSVEAVSEPGGAAGPPGRQHAVAGVQATDPGDLPQTVQAPAEMTAFRNSAEILLSSQQRRQLQNYIVFKNKYHGDCFKIQTVNLFTDMTERKPSARVYSDVFNISISYRI